MMNDQSVIVVGLVADDCHVAQGGLLREAWQRYSQTGTTGFHCCGKVFQGQQLEAFCL